jgi:gliding motility-associated-like protein
MKAKLFHYNQLLLCSLVVAFMFVSKPIAYSQDVWLQNHLSPNSGCGLSAIENVTVLIYNNSSSFIPSNNVTVYYSINGGSPVSQLLASNLAPNASWNFTFSTKANLSACGSFNMKVWTSYVTDPNHLNDTVSWVVQNDCPIVPGNVISNVTVCQGANAGTLSLAGWSNGTIVQWESSTNAGATWSPIANTTSSNAFSNVTQNTRYRVIFEGGLCADDTSGFATISVQAPPITGNIGGSDSLCENVASGVLTLTGNNAPVLNWEYSTNNGATWNNIANTTTTNNYTSLTTTTIYRAHINGGVCTNMYSDTARIYVDPFYPQVTLAGDDSLCITNASGAITSAGPHGTILDWEFSTDNGATWNSLSYTAGGYNYISLTQTTYYRMITKGGKCPNGISDTAIIYVQPIPTSPTIGPPNQVCASSVTGNINVTGGVTPIADWEASTDNGATWTSVGSTANPYNYSGQTVTTTYRVKMDGVHCPDYYSNNVTITLDSPPTMGTLNSSSTVCQHTMNPLSLVGSVADSLYWQYSLDNGNTWTSIPNTNTTTWTTLPIMSNISYQVVGVNGVCPPLTSNSILLTMLPAPTVNAGNDTSIYLGDTAHLVGIGGAAGIWMPGSTLSDSTIANPSAFPTVSTPYIYYVIGSNGCIGSDTVLVTVLPPKDFIIRNIVTMNKDNFNDYWYISGIDYYPFTAVEVFNLYGKQVYKSDDYKNDWAGTSNGKNLPNGTYYYIVRKGGTDEQYKGTLTLLGNE